MCVAAEDEAGHLTTAAPFLVQVRAIPIAAHAYLPVILLRTTGGPRQALLWLPVGIKGIGDTELPEAPELLTPSAAVTITPTPAPTPRVALTTTVTPP